MTRPTSRKQLALAPAALSVEAELDRIAAMNKDELRSLWRQTKGQEPPQAFSKDLIARALAHWLQEERLGGLSPSLRRQLAAILGKTGSEPARHVKAGSIIVREYQGTTHEVMVVPDGFCWQGQIYASLSTIARRITGTSWNGPRFFGLRGKDEADGSSTIPTMAASPSDRRNPRAGQSPAGAKASRAAELAFGRAAHRSAHEETER
jgi:Protein of unknown function (DUF2924)